MKSKITKSGFTGGRNAAAAILILLIGFAVIACNNNGNSINDIIDNNDLQKQNLVISGTFATQNNGDEDAKFHAATVGLASKSVSRSAAQINADDFALEGLLEDGDIIFKLRGNYNSVTRTYTLSAASSFLRYSISGEFNEAGTAAPTASAVVQIKSNDVWETFEITVATSGSAPLINGEARADTITALNDGIPAALQGIWRDPSDPDFYIMVNAFSLTVYSKYGFSDGPGGGSPGGGIDDGKRNISRNISYSTTGDVWYEETMYFTDVETKDGITSGISAYIQEFSRDSIPWDKYNDLINVYAAEVKGWRIYQAEDVSDYLELDAEFIQTDEAKAIINKYPLLRASSGYYYSFKNEINNDAMQDIYNRFSWALDGFLKTREEYSIAMGDFLKTPEGINYNTVYGITIGNTVSPVAGDRSAQEWRDFETAAFDDWETSAFHQWYKSNKNADLYTVYEAYSTYMSEFINSSDFTAFVNGYSGINMSDINKEWTFIFDTDPSGNEWSNFWNTFHNSSAFRNLNSNKTILEAYLAGPGAANAAALGGATLTFYYGLEYPVHPQEPTAAWQAQSNAYWDEYYRVMDTWAEKNGRVTWNMVYRQYGLWDEMYASGYIDRWIAENTREGGIIQIYSKWAMKVENNRLKIGSYYQQLESPELPSGGDGGVDTENNVSRNPPSVNVEMPEGDLLDFTDYETVKKLKDIEWSDMSLSR